MRIITCLPRPSPLRGSEDDPVMKATQCLLCSCSGFSAETGRLSVKGQTVNIFSFVGHSVSVTTTQLCRRRKSHVDNVLGGADGNVEAKGMKGDQGARGPPGKHGPKGLVGPVGEKGLRGDVGPPGQKGEKGDVGPLGPDGPKGSTGPSGPTGLPGPVGPVGKPGPKGDPGPLGPQGEPGVRGVRGWKGDRGEKGKIGETPVLPKSAFTVGLTVLSKFPPSDVPIRFDRILYNEFNHYDVATGKFTCHIAGAYYFTYHVTVFSRNVQVSLVKNGVKMLHTKDGYMSSEDQASGGLVLQLKLGDEVWLQVTGGERFNGLFADEDDDTTFTGFLLFSSS
nr:complement C1q and tumor necrosis factor-related protein 9 isoform X1 [Vicugna pacos]